MIVSDDVSLLRRYLIATRHQCRFPDGPEAEAAAQIASRGFPGIDLNCIFVSVRSRNRRCEYRAIGTTSFVVLDLELSDRLMELDLLAQLSAMKADWVYAFFVVLLGDAFRQEGDLKRYRYCVLKARGDVESLRRLSSLPKDGPPIHAALAPVVLHEIAHVVYRRNEPFVETLREFCRVTLIKFADLSAEQAATGRPPIPGGTVLGVPFERYDQVRLKQQLEQYVSTIRNNNELEEELTCDFISALAFINFEGRTNCFHEITPQSMPLSVRQLGDIFYLAIKTSRSLQIFSGIQQFGANVSAGSTELHREIMEMTARTNGLTHLLLSIFQAQVGTTDFNPKPDFGKPLTIDQINAGMHRSIAHLMRQHHERLLGPFEDLTGFFVTAESFEKDNGELLSSFEAVPDSFAAVDEIRQGFPF